MRTKIILETAAEVLDTMKNNPEFKNMIKLEHGRLIFEGDSFLYFDGDLGKYYKIDANITQADLISLIFNNMGVPIYFT